ncbi:hypothetical protein ACHHYP_20802 [Achlya hypogyna]|uniref:Thioredoxin domain-containing protein n=1 Tax=Achlya hypogyna TaxID=1202772 RepID=A0A1V9Y9B8_ACHHY|nr:hypothetical protein ACHHYP_20802 [Achlya hypogyna]
MLLSPVIPELCGNSSAALIMYCSESYPGIEFAKVDVDALNTTAVAAGICDIPTLHFYLNGKQQKALEVSFKAKTIS